MKIEKKKGEKKKLPSARARNLVFHKSMTSSNFSHPLCCPPTSSMYVLVKRIFVC